MNEQTKNSGLLSRTNFDQFFSQLENSFERKVKSESKEQYYQFLKGVSERGFAHIIKTAILTVPRFPSISELAKIADNLGYKAKHLIRPELKSCNDSECEGGLTWRYILSRDVGCMFLCANPYCTSSFERSKMNIWPNVPKSPEVITHMDWLILNEPEKPKIANMARLFRDHYTPPTEKELARKRELLKIQQQAKEWAKKKEGFRRSETLYSHPAFINREFDEFV